MKRGFTLVELSISLLIIGLIMGGIAVGYSVVNTATNRAILSEYNMYRAATNNFFNEYQYFPGDFANASYYWSNGSTCTSGNCNGNGDGFIDGGSNATNSDEGLHAWQHLNFAKLINNSYTGIHSVSSQNDIGVNVPASKAKNTAGWAFSAYQPYLSNKINNIYLGAFKTSAANTNPSVTGVDAYWLDSKIDDGMPTTGAVQAIPSGSGVGYCINTAVSSTAYNLSTSIVCTPSFEIRL